MNMTCPSFMRSELIIVPPNFTAVESLNLEGANLRLILAHILIRRPEVAGTPVGCQEDLVVPVIRNNSLSVHDRPAIETNVFMIRDKSLTNKEFRNR